MPKIKLEQEIYVEDTNTTGTHEYVVALVVGGLMENPNFEYEDYQIIRADDEEEAVKKYNELNNCFYFYGKVIKQLD